jgi:aspartate dehydrogenase
MQSVDHDGHALPRATDRPGGSSGRELPIAIAGFGSIGRLVGRHLDQGVAGLRLVAVSARDLHRARDRLKDFRVPVAAVSLASIADQADVVVECTPPEVFCDAVAPAIERRRTIVTVSATALLEHPEVVDHAKATGARIILVSGSVLGFDAIRAAGVGTISSLLMITRKPPLSMLRTPWVIERGIDVTAITAPTKIFTGTAREAARAFPDKFNIAAAVALAGGGPDRVQIEIWLDPTVERNIHRILVDADSTRFEMEIQNVPNPGHEGTGPLTAYSVIAALKDLTSTLRIGT